MYICTVNFYHFDLISSNVMFSIDIIVRRLNIVKALALALALSGLSCLVCSQCVGCNIINTVLNVLTAIS